MLKKLMTSARTVKVSSNSQLQLLHLFLDKHDYLGDGGRLQHAHLPQDSRHKLILPPTHHLIELIMDEHLRLMHVGPQLLSVGSIG